ncbi:uncharacterized protein LOC108197248 isoform X2 [Daucus carota subsp. sativus]|uniref:uncharacterized protein LOC108197248 isoform X2 n=1 Tax=Daucus carota subsp. sativus TaxID=79200 RepID=UPI0030835160
MGVVPSSPRRSGAQPPDTAEYLIGRFVGEISLPITSDYWNKLLELPIDLHWPSNRVQQACQVFEQNNCSTRHLAKILIHLAWCLQELISDSRVLSSASTKAINAMYISSVFLKYLIEDAKSDTFEELYLSLNESEELPNNFLSDQSIEYFVMHSILTYIGQVDVSPNTCLLHHGLLDFMLVAMSTQLLSGPSPGPSDVHPFIDAAISQESSTVALVVSKLLLNYITQPQFPVEIVSYAIFSEDRPGVLKRVGSAAANFMLLPLTYLVSSTKEASRNPLAESSLNILLTLIHYRKCFVLKHEKDTSVGTATSDSLLKEDTYLSENPYCKALANAKDVEYFLEYVLVRTDLDTLLMPLLETLYNASKRSSNQIYMVLIILLILSQDSTFSASIHKLILPNVPWYEERILHQISLGSLMVIILIRTVKYNLSMLRDVYLHTNCLATLANMAPHVHRLSAFASQRLVSLFYMLSRKYSKLAELKNNMMHLSNGELKDDDISEDTSPELHIYTDFLRIVLEILNAILTYALPRNPEVVYAIMHRQEVFQPFKSHPRFNELIENIFTVLDFFNARIDAQNKEGEWSVEKVLQVINVNCRSWRGEGMKMFTQLRFTYEQESHPEEFFIPYVWQLVVSRSGFSFNPKSINLFPVDIPVEISYEAREVDKLQTDEEL